MAVVAGGVDVIYPPENDGLHRLIAAEGAIVAECRPGVQPQARHFPPRNRIIAGLSRGVVVIEASLRSGSLITARMALEQGREVFAVPGSPLDPRARGGNDLIRQGAVLTESVHDVLTVLGAAQAAGDRPTAGPGSEAETTALLAPDDPLPDRARHVLEEALSPEPVSVDEIIRSCQLSYAVVTTLLLELELAGRIERHPGNRVSRIAPAHERA
jgi:DNA processing protein